MIVFIMILATLLAGSVCVNIWLVGLLRDAQDASEMEWADPDKLREVDE